jgi:site-specific DNA recombinase
MPIGDLEAVYREQLHHFLISPDEIDAHDAAAVEAMREKERLIASAEAELRRIETEDENLFQLYAARELTKEDFGRRHRPLSERRGQLEDELPRVQAELDILRISTFSRKEALGEARDLTARWADLPLQEKRQIVEAITDRIVIGKEDVEITLLHLPSGSDSQKATRPHGFMAATS